jgi:hypothetical protein
MNWPFVCGPPISQLVGAFEVTLMVQLEVGGVVVLDRISILHVSEIPLLVPPLQLWLPVKPVEVAVKVTSCCRGQLDGPMQAKLDPVLSTMVTLQVSVSWPSLMVIVFCPVFGKLTEYVGPLPTPWFELQL